MAMSRVVYRTIDEKVHTKEYQDNVEEIILDQMYISDIMGVED